MSEAWPGVLSRTPLKPRSPANVEAAQLFKENVKEYERKVRVSRGSCDHSARVIVYRRQR